MKRYASARKRQAKASEQTDRLLQALLYHIAERAGNCLPAHSHNTSVPAWDANQNRDELPEVIAR